MFRFIVLVIKKLKWEDILSFKVWDLFGKYNKVVSMVNLSF